MHNQLHNWAGNIAYSTDNLRAPATLAELQDLVRRTPHLRPLGSRHSFNRIADSGTLLLDMRRLDRIIAIDSTARTVTVEGGITYGQLCPALDAANLALHNLASLPHIGVVGAVSTATHGSGIANRNLAAAVSALEIVTASGDILALSRGDPDFEGAVVSLGALGVVSKITLDLAPAFAIRQNGYTGLRLATLIDNFDAIAAAAYSVSCFTTWRDDLIHLTLLKSLAEIPPPPSDFFGAKAATHPIHPLPDKDAAPCTEQMGVPGPSFQRLPHFRMALTPSAGDELQSEYFVARRYAPDALRALDAVREKFATPLMISEIRCIAADNLWLSMAYGQDSVAVHFTWHPDWPAVREVLPFIEQTLTPFGVRPHWGKLFTLDKTALRSRYPRLADFHALADRVDPQGKFRNAFLAATIF